MGLTFVSVKVGNPANGHETAEVRCLVDDPLLGATTLDGFGLVLDP